MHLCTHVGAFVIGRGLKYWRCNSTIVIASTTTDLFRSESELEFVGEFSTLNTHLQHFKSRRILFNFGLVKN